MISLAWFRRDLRLDDNTMLAEACVASTAVIPVFIFDTTILDALDDRDDRRVTFIHRSLIELDAGLRAHGSRLVVRHGDPTTLIPTLAAECGAHAVFTNHDYEPRAIRRDEEVARRLAADGRALRTFKDQVVYERSELLTGSGTPFRVFTPYKRAWLARLDEDQMAGRDSLAERTPDLSRLARSTAITAADSEWKLPMLGFVEAPLWLDPGSTGAQAQLARFLPIIDEYKEQRDYPAVPATSFLSVHLRFGTISIRRLVREARARSSQGAATWLSELVWREFYQMILAQFPHVETRAFKPEYDAITWPGREEHFVAWCEGRTGYPIVDAAMRHFNATGWMHNRLRMVVAMFLTKDLLVDWRLGEGYFARHLLDFDLAANNGGWQWSASTGCDAQPYFRIFNPVLQSRKFDPDGVYIRTHVPELAGFDARLVHWPHEADMFAQRAAGCELGVDSPLPLVDHGVQRDRAIALFKDLPTRP